MSIPISPAPVTEWRQEFLPAYLSNGLVGLRVGHVPQLYGILMLSGFEGLDPETRVEASARAPYPLSGEVTIGRANLSDPGRAILREQRYDFACGELHTSVTFEADDVRAELETVTFCSRTQPTMILQQLVLRVDRDCEITCASGFDSRGVPGEWARNDPAAVGTRPEGPDSPFYWVSTGRLSTCGLAAQTEVSGPDLSERTVYDTGDRVGTAHTFQVRRGATYRLRRYVSVVPQLMHAQSHFEAQRLMKEARLRGFDTLRADNRAAWDELWQGRVVIEGAGDRWQALADAAFFYLQSSVNGSSPMSSSVFGLAYWPNYHYYRGHMMWDLETFALPPLVLTQPDTAAGLLRFRADRLPAARDLSRLSGYRGAKYPWESSLREGGEATPIESLGAAAEHHVSADVAIAFARYVYATGDLDFARDDAWPVLAAVAEWVESRIQRSDRGYEIRDVIGIAESGRLVDNSAFVNMSAAEALRAAVTVAHQLHLTVPDERWSEIADALVVPTDSRSRVIQNHDGYDPGEEQGATPEAPAGLFPLDYPVGGNTERHTFEYYVGYADRYAGQPMLSAMLGVYAARIGDRARSLDLFEKGYGQFVVDPYTVTLEYAPAVFPDRPRAGPFTANLGGFLTSCLYGLTGLHLNAGDPGDWCQRPIILPEGWDAIHVDRLWVRGQQMSLHAVHGDDYAHLAAGHATGRRD